MAGRKINLPADHVRQQCVLELAAEHGRDTNDLPGLRLQIIEARANDRLHGIGQ